VDHVKGVPLGKLLALPTNIRLGGKSLPDKHATLLQTFVNYA
jgi:hypothetical protein